MTSLLMKELDHTLYHTFTTDYIENRLEKILDDKNLQIYSDLFLNIIFDKNDWESGSPEYLAYFLNIKFEQQDNFVNVVSKFLRRLRQDIHNFPTNYTAKEYHFTVNFNIEFHGNIYPKSDNLRIKQETFKSSLIRSFRQLLNSVKKLEINDESEENDEIFVKYSKVFKTYYGEFKNENNNKCIKFEIKFNAINNINFKNFFFEYLINNDLKVVANIYKLEKDDGSSIVINECLK